MISSELETKAPSETYSLKIAHRWTASGTKSCSRQETSTTSTGSPFAIATLSLRVGPGCFVFVCYIRMAFDACATERPQRSGRGERTELEGVGGRVRVCATARRREAAKKNYAKIVSKPMTQVGVGVVESVCSDYAIAMGSTKVRRYLTPRVRAYLRCPCKISNKTVHMLCECEFSRVSIGRDHGRAAEGDNHQYL